MSGSAGNDIADDHLKLERGRWCGIQHESLDDLPTRRWLLCTVTAWLAPWDATATEQLISAGLAYLNQELSPLRAISTRRPSLPGDRWARAGRSAKYYIRFTYPNLNDNCPSTLNINVLDHFCRAKLRAMHSAAYAIAQCLFICLSVCHVRVFCAYLVLTLCGLALRSTRMTRPRVQRTSPWRNPSLWI